MRHARLVAAVAVVALAGACTPSPSEDLSPTPTPEADQTVAVPEEVGDRVAVIVAPPSLVARAEAAALRRAADEYADDPPDGIAEVRVVQATSEDFARDLAELAIDDGYDLVCIVGTGAAPLLLELARARRDGRFCGTDGNVAGGPVNLTSVALDPAALVEAGAIAIGAAPAPVGFLVAAPVGDVEALTVQFISGVAPPRQPEPSPSPSPSPAATTSPAPATDADATSIDIVEDPTSPSPSPSPGASPSPAGSPPPDASGPRSPFVTLTAGPGENGQVAAAEELAAATPTRALILATPGGTDAVSAAGATGAELVVVADWAVDQEGELPGHVLVSLTVDWEMLLRASIAGALTSEARQVRLLGVADRVLGALPGQVEGAEPAAQRTSAHLESRGAEAEAAAETPD